VAFGSIVELDDERMPLEGGLHDAALDAATAPVDETHLAQTRLVSGVHVLFDNGLDVARMERVKIDRVFERKTMHVSRQGLGLDARCSWWYSAVTVVLIPPRTENAPVTFMRRGRQTSTRSSRIWLVAAS